MTGYRWVAESYARLVREQFLTTTPFCAGSGKTLLSGDFNADGRTDLLCHDTAGTISIDYASTSTSTRYGATNWSIPTTWCFPPGTIHTGDFNGDGSSDLLCHDAPSGRIWIDFATAGVFTGTSDWNPGTGSNWCSGSTRRMYVGDVNGDAATDLICHRTTLGDLTVQFSDANNTPFVGAVDDDSSVAWNSGRTCAQGCLEGQVCEAGACIERMCVTSGTLTIADVSGDGYSDIVCRYPGGRSVGVRTFAGNPLDTGNTCLMNDVGWYMGWTGTRFPARSADAASRTWSRWY